MLESVLCGKKTGVWVGQQGVKAVVVVEGGLFVLMSLRYFRQSGTNSCKKI